MGNKTKEESVVVLTPHEILAVAVALAMLPSKTLSLLVSWDQQEAYEALQGARDKVDRKKANFVWSTLKPLEKYEKNTLNNHPNKHLFAQSKGTGLAVPLEFSWMVGRTAGVIDEINTLAREIGVSGEIASRVYDYRLDSAFSDSDTNLDNKSDTNFDINQI